MQDNILLHFNKFYLLEFFNYVQSFSEKYLSNADFRLISDLVDHLSAQSDVMIGLETLANEQGTSELSIFLFDFIERMRDYPPTLVYDSLPEMAEDFVNTAKVMMEEGESRDAIEKVNEILSSIKPVEMEELLPEEIVPEKEIVEVAKTEPVIELEETKLGDELHYAQFVEKVFDSKFELYTQKYHQTSYSNYLNLLRLKFTDISDDQELPAALAHLVFNLETIFPWKQNVPYDIIRHGQLMEDRMNVFFDHVAEFIDKHTSIVEKSIQNDRIESMEVSLVREEIPEQPMTIDSLLSEYFQSDVNDFIDKFGKSLEALRTDPTNRDQLQAFLELFRSFKEICMIHGYAYLEDLSTEIVTIVKEKQRKRRYPSESSFALLSQIIILFKDSEKLRSDIEETPEKVQIRDMLAAFSKSFEKKKDIIREKAKETEKPPEEEIAFSQKEKLGKIIFDLLKETLPDMEHYLAQKKFNPVKILLRKYIAAAKISSIIPLFDLFTTTIQAIETCESVTGDGQNEKVNEFITLYKNLVKEDSVDLDYELWQSRWADFCSVIPPSEEVLISLSDRDRLLQILLEIEDMNMPDFDRRLFSVLNRDDQEVRSDLKAHFMRLQGNSSLIAFENLRRFAGSFITLFESKTGFKFNEEQIHKLGDNYLTCIQRLKERGMQSDITDIIADIEQLFEESGTFQEESEEDLLAIFKEEGINYLNNIEKALGMLEANYKAREPYDLIEKNIHSLKSSARLMGYKDVVDLAAPIEEKCEAYTTKKMVAEKDSLPIFREIISGIRQLVLGQTVDVKELREKISEIQSIEVETSESELIAEALEKKTDDQRAAEKPLFSEAVDEDAEMLAIFKEESGEFIKTIDQANADLRNDLKNKEALHKQEYASHSLKSAAMMLGFREIGQLADAVEQVTESINRGELANNLGINEKIKQAVDVIKKITEGSKIEPDIIADILHTLDINYLKEAYQIPDKERSDKDDTIEVGSMGDLFLKESWEFIGKINRELVDLEKEPGNTDLIDKINRTVHTLKGSAQMMHFERIGSLAHKIEDYLENLKKSSEKNIGPVFDGLDEIQLLMQNIKSGKGEQSENYQNIIDNLTVKTTPQNTKTTVKPVVPSEDKIETEDTDDYTVRIRTGHLDSMINMAADLIVNKTKLSNYLGELMKLSEQFEKEKKLLKSAPAEMPVDLDKKAIPNEQVLMEKVKKIENEYKDIFNTYDSVSSKFTQVTQNLEEHLSQISILAKHLHDDILKTRMVPVETLFNRFPRAVRDMAHRQGKKVTLVVEGEDTELDRALVEVLSDPLMHLVRNAIDHGIETPEERIKNKKGEEGILLLKAKQDRNQIVIEVQDDGRGLNLDKIKQEIISRELATPTEVSDKSTNELINYIFTPGFSTLGSASDISGRGIGLDVVLSEVRKLKGDIRVNVSPGKGTTFRIRVPLSLVIIQALLIQLSSETFAIPLASVSESLYLEKNNINEKAGKLYYKIKKGEEIQLLDLAQMLGINRAKDEKQHIVLLDEAGSKFGVIVDKVLDRQDIVVKPISDQLNNVPYIAGGTILGDGSVCLILDMLALSREISDGGYSVEQDISSIEKARRLLEQKKDDIGKTPAVQAKKSALIVDDSISVRKFISSLLSKNNFRTILASNGDEALEQLKNEKFDLIITDLEMPRLDGFELIKQLREMNGYAEVPIIILSGRASKKHQEMGQKIGANAFIVKPFKEPDLLNTIYKFIKVNKK